MSSEVSRSTTAIWILRSTVMDQIEFASVAHVVEDYRVWTSHDLAHAAGGCTFYF